MSKSKCKITTTPSFLNYSNPEIFTQKPRSGGLSRKKLFDDETNMSEDDTIVNDSSELDRTGRDFRLKVALDNADWSLKGSTSSSSNSTVAPDPLKDSTDMLAVTISTILLLAAQAADISKEHLNWTIRYLSCVKDEFGHNPPNVRGILNHLKSIYHDLTQFESVPVEIDVTGKILDPDATYVTSDENRTTVRTTTTIKRKTLDATEAAEPALPCAAPEAPTSEEDK